MKTRSKLLLGSVVFIFVICLFMSGFCLTRRLWQAVADEPQKLVTATLTEGRVLHLDVRYEDGRDEHLVADLPPGPNWSRVTARPVDPEKWALQPMASPVDIDYSPEKDLRGDTSHIVWVDGAGCQSLVTLPEPVDWSSATPYLAVAVSLFTLIVDLLTGPIWVLWVILTVGGHGACWLPWCN